MPRDDRTHRRDVNAIGASEFVFEGAGLVARDQLGLDFGRQPHLSLDSIGAIERPTPGDLGFLTSQHPQ